jgi:hypothetical protein
VCVCVCVCFDKITNLIIVIGIGFKSSDSGVVNITACIVGEGAMETYIFRHIYLIYTFELVEKSKHATTTN